MVANGLRVQEGDLYLKEGSIVRALKEGGLPYF